MGYDIPVILLYLSENKNPMPIAWGENSPTEYSAKLAGHIPDRVR